LKASRHSAFTLVELLVVMVIIAVLTALVVPVIASVQAQARATKCLNQLRQIGLAARLYANENEQVLPFTQHQKASWVKTLQPYASGTITFRCPADAHRTRLYSYALNDFLTPDPAGARGMNYSKITRIPAPAETLLFAEATEKYVNADHFHFAEYKEVTVPPEVFSEQVAVQRHGGKSTYLFTDAHVEALSWETVQDLLQKPAGRFINPEGSPAAN
jgi:prepilin-type N-terminal cleavage/methylation domain-containing protein/prepilin-type processing-associated H-X9-DG protein